MEAKKKKALEEAKKKKAVEEARKKKAAASTATGVNGVEKDNSSSQKRKSTEDNSILSPKSKKRDSEKDGIEKGTNSSSSSSIISSGGKKKSPKQTRPEKMKSYINEKIAKTFEDGVIYFGVVKERFDEEEPFWNIQYEDGDGEDLVLEEILKGIAFYKSVEKKKKGNAKLKVFTPTK